MGGSTRWLKSLLSMKKSASDKNHSTVRSKKIWNLWRKPSEKALISDTKPVCRNPTTQVSESDKLVATSKPVSLSEKQNKAAALVQSAFRGLLARRALKALKSVVRIQAIFRGQQVRKRAIATLRCMETLVRVQTRVKSQRINLSYDNMLNECSCDFDSSYKHAGNVRPKPRGIALDYALSQQRRSICALKELNDFNFDFSPPYTDSVPSSDTVHGGSTSSSSFHSSRKMDDKSAKEPRYMSFTESVKAKQRTLTKPFQIDDSRFSKSLNFSNLCVPRKATSRRRSRNKD